MFYLVLSLFYLFWAGLMAVEAVMFKQGEIPLPPDSPPLDFMVAVCVGMAILSALTMLVLLVSGLWLLLSKSTGAKVMGILTAIVQIISFWGICVYPFALAAGIYGLIVLIKESRVPGTWNPQ